MTAEIYEFSTEWYDYVVSQKFTLRNINQSSPRPWGGAGSVVSTRPHTQVWISEVTMAPLRDPVLQDMDAFFTRLKGRSSVLRLSNALRLSPWYDRNLIASTVAFSDDTLFTDGTGFVDGLLSSTVYVVSAALAGTNYIVLGGFPASTDSVLRRGDLIQIKPSGVAGSVPHLYKVMYGGGTDASGQIGFEIEPLLRANIAAGDSVGLRYPSGLFRLIDDNQGDISAEGAGVGSFGFSVIEALDLVP